MDLIFLVQVILFTSTLINAQITLTPAVLTALGYNTNSASINLEKRGIVAIQDNTFNGYTNLKQLSMGNNKLSSIGVNTFSGLTNLETLDLVNNTVSTIAPNSFQALSKLLVLDLTNSNISSISASTFTGKYKNSLILFYIAKVFIL